MFRSSRTDGRSAWSPPVTPWVRSCRISRPRSSTGSASRRSWASRKTGPESEAGVKILGVGLGRTGTMSLTLALRRLGFRAMHYDRVRLNDILDGSNPAPDFRRYDDVDAVLDIPSAYFYRELLDAYPEAKEILTVRDVEAWWKSIERHVNVNVPYLPPKMFGYDHRRRTLGASPMTDPGAHNHFMMLLLNCVYGSTIALEFLYKKKYL